MCGSLRRRAAAVTLAGQQAEARRRPRARSSARTAAACRGRRRAAARRRPRARAARSSSPSARARCASPPGTRRRRAGSRRRRARSASWSAVMTDARADVLERLLDAAPVAHPVVDDRDHVTSASPSWTGTPVSRGSIADGGAQRAGERLEARLDHVVRVRAGLQVEVQRQPGAPRRPRGRTPPRPRARSRRCRPPAAARSPRRRSTGARRRRSRTRRAPRPSGSRRGRSGRCRARSPSARSSAWPSTIPVSSTVWCEPVCRSPSTLDVEVQPPVAGEQVEHVVEEPDAGARACPRPVAVQAQPQRDARSPPSGGRSRAVALAHGRGILPDLHRRGVPGEALGARDRRRRRAPARPRRRRGGPRPCAAGSAARTARRRSARRRRWAACGWSRPRSRRTRCPVSAPTNRQPARRTRGASASAAAPASCRCSGASASANASAASSRRRRSTVASAGARRARSSSSAASSLHGHHERALAVLGLREQVEPPARSGSAPADRITVRSLGPAKPSIPTSPDTWRLASCTHRLPGPTITSTAGTRLGAVGERGDRLRAAHPVHRVDPAQRARGEDRRVLAGGHDHLVDAGRARGHGAHHDGRRVRVAARPGRRSRRGRPGMLAQPHGVALRAAAPRPRRRAPASATAPHVRDRDLQPRAHVAASSAVQRRRQLLRGRRAAALAAAEAPLVARAAPRRRPRARRRRSRAPRRPPTRPAARTPRAHLGRAAPAARRRTRAAHAGATDPRHDVVDRRRLELVRDRVGDQPRGRGRDLLADHEPVLAQRRAGRGEVDDPVHEPGQRRELDRALDLDDLRLAAGALEVGGRDPRVLRRHAHHAEPPQRLGRAVLAVDGREHHPARPEAEVEQLVDVALGVLGEHVLAGDAEVGGARLDVGRHVGRAAS